MMKIEQIFDKSMDSYGGLYFFRQFIDRSGFNSVVEKVLGKRPSQAAYTYTEVFTSYTADHTKLYTIKPDAQACYKGLGYYASCFSTDQIPLYVSLQSGNATPKTKLVEVLEAGLKAMKEQELSYDIFQLDRS